MCDFSIPAKHQKSHTPKMQIPNFNIIAQWASHTQMNAGLSPTSIIRSLYNPSRRGLKGQDCTTTQDRSQMY